MNGEKIADIILHAEEKWLEKSKEYVKQQFSEVFLPSHDITHHLRTWENAKQLLLELGEHNPNIKYPVAEASLLSCMFHDTGLAISNKKNHGTYSKECYQSFIDQDDEEIPELQSDILRAIELHDLKSRDLFLPLTLNDAPDILTVTGISDDIDALGYIGVYRYSEIYLHRNVSMKLLGIQILENVAVRFSHLQKATAMLPSLSKKLIQPYKEIIQFFDEYNQQILVEMNYENTYNGNIGIVNFIRQFSVEGKIKPEDFLDALNNTKVGKFVLDYFQKLEHDIKGSKS